MGWDWLRLTASGTSGRQALHKSTVQYRSLLPCLHLANMTTTQTLDGLITQMKGGSSTNFWDVVVSYSVDNLNRILQILWAGNKSFADVVIVAQGVDRLGPYTITFNLKLGSPTLQFVAGAAGQALLEMSLNGTYAIDPDPPKPVPPNQYILQAIVPLASVSGTEVTGSNPTVRIPSIQPCIDLTDVYLGSR